MTDGVALHRAVIADPADDTPRLVYADWLDENGQEERAEFIRVQIQNAGLPIAQRQQEVELLRQFRKVWDKPYRALFPGGAFTYSRGFVASVRTEWRFYQSALAPLLRMSPVEQVVVGKSYFDLLTGGNYLPYPSQPPHVRFCLAVYQPDGHRNSSDVDILRVEPAEMEPFLRRGRWVVGCNQRRSRGWVFPQYPIIDYESARNRGSRSQLAIRPFRQPSEFNTWCPVESPDECWRGCWLVLEDGERVDFRLQDDEGVANWLSTHLAV